VKFEILELDQGDPPKSRRSTLKPEFVKVPIPWAEALLGSTNVSAYRLALAILTEAFRRKIIGGEIVLSSEMTGMSGTIRRRAATELERLGLIRIERQGKKAFRVILI